MILKRAMLSAALILSLLAFSGTVSGQNTPTPAPGSSATTPAPAVKPTPDKAATSATAPDAATTSEATTEATPPAALATTDNPGDDKPVEKTAFDEFMSKVQAGGYIGYIIITLSIIAFAFVIERVFNLRRATICPDGLAPRVLELLKRHQYDEALRQCQQNNSVLARVLASVVRHRRFSFSEISLVAGDEAGREMRHQMQMAYPLAIVATLSPLLGLLGTVIGMVGAFEAVALAGSMGDPSVMATEISFALVTTAMGLIIAVPALGCYHILRTRTTLLTTRLEAQVSETLSEWRIAVLEENHQGEDGSGGDSGGGSPRERNGTGDAHPVAASGKAGVAKPVVKEGR